MIKAVIFDMFETLVTMLSAPSYFGADMAEEAGISAEQFGKIWHKFEYDQTVGKLTLEEAVAATLNELGCYSGVCFQQIILKRNAAKAEVFKHIDPDIIRVLKSLKEIDIKIGMISNCFSEENELIRQSVLYQYFDAPFLSYEQGICKPDKEIFNRCLNKLGIIPEEGLYIGDGGSSELEAAGELGMHPMQAVWYLREDTRQPCGRKTGYIQLEKPLDIMEYII